MINEKELIKATNELGKIVRKNLYGSENNRQIRSFLNLFPKLETIIKNSQLTPLENIEIYNENLSQINNLTPNTFQKIWEIYRRNLFTATFVIDTKQTQKLTPKELDIYMANQYTQQIELLANSPTKEWIGEEDGKIIYGPTKYPKFYSVDKKSPFELIDITKAKQVPINLYEFRNKFTKQTLITHFDLGSSSIPFLKEYKNGPMSFKTRSYFNDLENLEHLKKERLDSYYQNLANLKQLNL